MAAAGWRASTPATSTKAIEILAIESLGGERQWIASEALDLGDAYRATPVRSAAEALLLLDGLGAQPQPVEPLYVEGPPIQPPKAK